MASLDPAGAAAQAKAFLQDATSVVAQDNRVNLNRVPVRGSTGAYKYFDIALVFNVAPNGTVTLNAAATKITASPSLAVGGFKPGLYTSSVDGQWCDYQVGSPGAVGGARTAGSLSLADGWSRCILSLDWVTGPVAGHPDQARLQEAGITTNAYSWGIVGGVGADFGVLGWEPGDIVGVVQTGNSLVVRNYGDDNRVDATANFTYCPTCE
jgi:hypothetical protein